MSVLTKEQIETERLIYEMIKRNAQNSGNSQFIRDGLIDDLLETISVLESRIAERPQSAQRGQGGE